MSRRIPIKKTNRKVPRSKYMTNGRLNAYMFLNKHDVRIVTDLSVGLENPLKCGDIWSVSGVSIHYHSHDEHTPKQPLHKRLTKLFKRKS